jgi:signal peptidase
MEAVIVSGSEASATVEETQQESAAPKRVIFSSRLVKWSTRLVMVSGAVLATVVLALTVGPRFLPYQTYTVLSGSMEPTLPIGSVIVTVPAQAEELKVGDVITIANPQHAGTLVTHRIFSVESSAQGRGFKTKGDANQAPDSWIVPANGGGWRYAFAIPYLGYILSALQSGLGRLVLLILPTLLLGGLLLVEIWRPARAPDEVSDRVVAVGA